LKLVYVAKGLKKVEEVFSDVKWGASSKSTFFKSVVEPEGRCQTVITHSTPGQHAAHAAKAIANRNTWPVEAISMHATESGDHNSSQLHKKYDRLLPELIAPAIKAGVPRWILSLLNICVGNVVETLCHNQLTPMKGSLMFFDPDGKDIVLPQPAHIDYDPENLYFPDGMQAQSGRARVVPASVFIFSFSKEYNLFWWKDFCGPNVLEKIADNGPFGVDGPYARSAMDWMTDPAFTNSQLTFGDLLWCDGSMVHCGASYYDSARRPVFRVHVFACSRDKVTADSLSEQVDADTFFVQTPGRMSSSDPIQDLIPSWWKKNLKKAPSAQMK
jgi:hypothetical protein